MSPPGPPRPRLPEGPNSIPSIMRRTVLLSLVAVLLASCVSFTPRSDEDGVAPLPDATLDQDDAPPPRSRTADVVERVLPSLVNVRVQGFQSSPLTNGKTRGQGSGAIIDESGVIVTNNHVVSGAVSVEVFFTDDNESVEGRVLGTDPERDLAVIKVPTSGLTPIDIGSSDSLRLGDDVIALGFPLGLGGPTVTAGIVSGKNRNLEIPRSLVTGAEDTVHFQGLLQIDAAINPGNSGGPLVDAAGRLVGINTAAAGAGSAENVGFAIAIDDALPVIEEILTKPPEDRPWLGVIISSLDPAGAEQLGLDRDLEGAVITDLVPEGPAEAAGLEPGDVIVAIDGNDIVTGEDLTETLSQFEPGDTIEVDIVNADGAETVEVVLAARPATFE